MPQKATSKMRLCCISTNQEACLGFLMRNRCGSACVVQMTFGSFHLHMIQLVFYPFGQSVRSSALWFNQLCPHSACAVCTHSGFKEGAQWQETGNADVLHRRSVHGIRLSRARRALREGMVGMNTTSNGRLDALARLLNTCMCSAGLAYSPLNVHHRKTIFAKAESLCHHHGRGSRSDGAGVAFMMLHQYRFIAVVAKVWSVANDCLLVHMTIG
ncbi:hypothetical protein M011DRAFT_459427 [Sporormia fimetaria CBS 119925]|uniref:Uncharacterized protein n=1 Tax=Sporormia fimetaria CBS 119925 TaxID=1340428 RepID=A0A6A6V869_9PLEO|nr:hypothetical protein M011DRAFT_459427 [Sporormia fimetaria CBS 119925]